MFANSKRPTPPQAPTTPTIHEVISDPPSILSAGLTITGNLATDGELQIDGAVEGDIAAAKLTLGERAKIKGEITVEILIVRGEITGSVHARQVQLAASARIHGDICHETLAIEAGARVDGLLKHADYRPAKGKGKDKPGVAYETGSKPPGIGATNPKSDSPPFIIPKLNTVGA
jgi:cytoskeletal protein CcmA (bactofilin family)